MVSSQPALDLRGNHSESLCPAVGGIKAKLMMILGLILHVSSGKLKETNLWTHDPVREAIGQTISYHVTKHQPNTQLLIHKQCFCHWRKFPALL